MDGILTTNVRRNGIGDGGENIFPSIETIQEIKVSSINNGAEYAQVGDITTITKGGTNQIHGTAFWNYNGNGLNANPNYFNRALPARTVANNFGGSAGGPVFRDKTFFFGAFERLSIYGVGLSDRLQFRKPTSGREISPALRPRSSILQQAILLLGTSFQRAGSTPSARSSWTSTFRHPINPSRTPIDCIGTPFLSLNDLQSV